MTSEADDTKRKIYDKVVELAAQLGADASALGYDDLIPTRSGLDSAGVMELVLWYEMTFGLDIPDEDLNTDNLGTVNLMAGYRERRVGER